LLCLRDRRHFAAFVPLAVAGHVSLFPLLFTHQEFPVKTVYTVFWLVAVLVGFDKIAPPYVPPFFLSLPFPLSLASLISTDQDRVCTF
jgi:hypothetical protein